MAPRTFLTTLAILAVSTSVTGQSGTGTGTGYPTASVTVGAPYPITNGTLPVGPTGTLPSSIIPPSLPGSSCPTLTTTTTSQVTVTVTVPASGPTAPYPISGGTGLPVGTGTGTGTGFALPTGYAKRMEMRGLKRGRKEKKRAAGWW